MIYLISLKTLKDVYIVDDNIEDKYILSNITKGQKFIINSILGDDKYNELLDQVDNNTVSAVNKILLDKYIEPIIAYYVLSEVVYTTAYKMKNVGVTDNNPNSDRFSELVKISRKYLNDSEQYQQLLKNYICDNSIVTDNDGKKPALKTGIYIDSSKPTYWNTDGSDCNKY